MKLSTLEKALVFSLADDGHGLTLDEFEEYLKARDEIVRLADICEDGLETPVSIVSWYALSNLFNIATYDDFGKIRKLYKNNRRAEIRRYRTEVRTNICEEFTDGQIDSIADFLRDLWDDNEAAGGHKSDGTFNRSEQADCDVETLRDRVKTLETIINKLYHHRGLSPDDMSAIQLCIH